MPRDTYGDWCVPPESPKLIHSQDPARKTDGTLLGTAYYYHDLLRLMARYARLLGKPADAAEFEQLAARVRAAFQQQVLQCRDAGYYGNGTQTSSILPLALRTWRPSENAQDRVRTAWSARSSRRATATSAPAWSARSG